MLDTGLDKNVFLEVFSTLPLDREEMAEYLRGEFNKRKALLVLPKVSFKKKISRKIKTHISPEKVEAIKILLKK